MQNVIEREISIKASQEQVYEAITNAEQVVHWFPETLEGNYAIGERPIFGFGEHGKNQVYIVDAKPHHYFAYRWVPGSNHFLGDVLSVPNTLVEFFIEEENSTSCKLILKESGFADLPPELMTSAHEQNSKGWNFMLERLVIYSESH